MWALGLSELFDFVDPGGKSSGILRRISVPATVSIIIVVALSISITIMSMIGTVIESRLILIGSIVRVRIIRLI